MCGLLTLKLFKYGEVEQFGSLSGSLPEGRRFKSVSCIHSLPKGWLYTTLIEAILKLQSNSPIKTPEGKWFVKRRTNTTIGWVGVMTY